MSTPTGGFRQWGDDELLAVLQDLLRLEPVFHHPELGATRADFDRTTDANFWETGASGRRYGREEVWAVLERRYADSIEDEWQVTDPRVQIVGSDTYLMTYTLIQIRRVTRRATLWQRRGNDWVVLYHQGTVVAD